MLNDGQGLPAMLDRDLTPEERAMAFAGAPAMLAGPTQRTEVALDGAPAMLNDGQGLPAMLDAFSWERDPLSAFLSSLVQDEEEPRTQIRHER